jgi:hypothetical protein
MTNAARKESCQIDAAADAVVHIQRACYFCIRNMAMLPRKRYTQVCFTSTMEQAYLRQTRDTLEADKSHESDFIFLTRNPTCTAAFLDDLVNYRLEARGRGGLGIEPCA